MGTKNWVFKSSGRLDWTNTSNCVYIDYYFSCPYCAHRRLTEAYQYVITPRLQIYPVEKRFFQNRQMSGGKCLDNLQEVLNSKRISRCRSLIKENEVTAGYVAKKLIKRSHCDSYKILLKARGVDIANDHTEMFFLVAEYSCYQSHFLFTLLFWILFVGNIYLAMLCTRIWFYKCQLSRLGI